MANLAKIRHGLGKYSFWTLRVAPWRLASENSENTRQSLNKNSNNMAKGAPFENGECGENSSRS